MPNGWGVIPPLIGNPYNRYINLYYKVDEFIPTIGKQWELIDPNTYKVGPYDLYRLINGCHWGYFNPISMELVISSLLITRLRGPETNSWRLKMDVWKTHYVSFWGRAYFEGSNMGKLLVLGNVPLPISILVINC